MSQFGLSLTIDLGGSLTDLPGNVFMRLRECLDYNPEDKDWRALICAVEDRREFKVMQKDVEKWAASKSGSSKLLTFLSSRGMTVLELEKYLRRIHVDTFTLGLSSYEDIQIIEVPEERVEVFEGSVLELEVKAIGNPFPRYQWFFCKDGQDEFSCLVGRTEGLLRIHETTKGEAGCYSCQIHNCDIPQKTKLSRKTLVAVVPDPNPPEKGLNPPDQADVASILRNITLSPQIVPLDDNRVLQGRSAMLSGDLIIRHPVDVTIGANDRFTLSVETNGNPPIVYQWYRNGRALPDQLKPVLHVNCACAVDFGDYYCEVNNGSRKETSRVAHVTEYCPRPGNFGEIIMISQPKSVSVKFGGCALFNCEAKHCEPLRYQWFKDGQELVGETGTELKIVNIQDRRPAGWYQCEVSVIRNNACVRRLTSGACLTVEIPLVTDNIEYNPSGKVALLIGNYDYRSEQPLTAPRADVQDLYKALCKLDFKVVSLLNLTKTEIENAVLEFCHLVEQNVYVLFYFCGHGFEEEGSSYLVPTDAPSGYQRDECVCVDMVLENIQRKEPPLICMIIDICRKVNKVRSPSVPRYIEKKMPKGNTLFCYATSVGLNAYENKRNGLLVQYLLPLLNKPIGIESLMSELREEFNRVQKHCNIQIPELRTNLQEPRRSLADKMSYKGYTNAIHKREIRWKLAHEKPEKRRLHVQNLGVVIELDFQAEFSNILHIFITVINKGVTDQCMAAVRRHPASVSMMDNIKNICDPAGNITTIACLQDIQKLKDNLIIGIGLHYTIPGHANQYEQYMNCDLGLPLVSKLKLWQKTTNFAITCGEATEHTEETDSL